LIADAGRRFTFSSNAAVLPPATNSNLPGFRPRAAGHVDSLFSMSRSSSDFSPGSRASIEILERIFPLHGRCVLDMVLAACDGDLVRAIEQLLAARDTLRSNHEQHHRYRYLHQQQSMHDSGI